MSENDFKKTYDGFTKFVLWGTILVISTSDTSNYATLKFKIN